jgi:hypothetical protein
MGNAANMAKAKWNAAHYKQLKFNISPKIATEFKRSCEKAGVSMAGEAARFMAEHSAAAIERKAAPAEDLTTRRKRRKAVAEITLKLERVLEAETGSHENVPENLRGTDAYEEDEERLSTIEQAIEALGSIY